MTSLRSAVHTCRMTELLRVALRAIGVVLPAAAILGVVELLGGGPDGDFDLFVGAILLSLLAAALWAGFDAQRVSTIRVLIRWVAVTIVVGGALALESTFVAPGGPSSERTSEAVSSSLFYGVPLLLAAGLGVLFGMASASANEQSRRRYDDTV